MMYVMDRCKHHACGRDAKLNGPPTLMDGWLLAFGFSLVGALSGNRVVRHPPTIDVSVLETQSHPRVLPLASPLTHYSCPQEVLESGR